VGSGFQRQRREGARLGGAGLARPLDRERVGGDLWGFIDWQEVRQWLIDLCVQDEFHWDFSSV
jgi:hypothetical protein